MPDLTNDQRTAVAERRVMRRMFLWVEARDPATGDPSPAGFWDDAGDVEVDGRTHLGRGRISVSSIKGESNLSIPGMTVTLSGIEPSAVALINARSIAQARVEVLFGIYDVDNHTLIPPLIRMFRGVLDEVDVRTPARGKRASIELSCESIARVLTVKRTETRSPETHKQRESTDEFSDYTSGLRERTIYFGRREPNASKASARGGRTGGGA